MRNQSERRQRQASESKMLRRQKNQSVFVRLYSLVTSMMNYMSHGKGGLPALQHKIWFGFFVENYRIKCFTLSFIGFLEAKS